MAGKGLNLKAVLRLESQQFTKGINNIKKQLQSFSGFLKGAFALGSVTAFGKQMIQVGADFENAMAKVQAVSNATTKEFQAMQKEAQRLGSTTKYTATQAAEALESLTRNGLSAGNATKALSNVLQLAQANAIELANAADIVTNTMNAFGLSVNDLNMVNDVLSSTASNAATNINELYEALVVAGPYAKIMGSNLEEASTAIGILANQGIKGSNAGKTLAAMYQRLSAITPKAAKVLSQYGLDIDETTVKTQDLSKTLKQLRDSGIGNSVEALSNLFGKNYAGNIAQLINAVDDFDVMLNTVANSAGTTERMFNQGVGSVRKELDTLKSSYEGLLISISQKTSGIVKGAIRLLQNLVNNFKTVGGTIMNIASVVVPLLASNITKLVRTIKLAATETAAATALAGGWITAVASLVTWVGTALVGAWNRATEAMREAKKEMGDVERNIRNTQTSLDNLTSKLGPDTDDTTLAGVVSKLCELFPEFTTAIQEAAKEAARTGDWVKLKKELQDIADLQAAIASRDAKSKLQQAQNHELGRRLYNSTTFFGALRSGQFTTATNEKDAGLFGSRGSQAEFIVNPINRAIKDGFKGNGFTKDQIRDEFDYIASILTENNTVDEGYEKLAKYLKDLNVSIPQGEELLKEYVRLQRSGGYVNAAGGFRDNEYQTNPQYQETGRQVHAADSTIAVKMIAKAFDTFEHSLNNATADRADNKLTEDAFKKKVADALGEYEQVVIKYHEYATQEQKDQLAELHKIYDQPIKTKTNNGPGGGGGKTDPTPKEQIQKELDNYQKALEKLNARKAAGTIENFDSEVEDLQVSTLETLTSFTDLDTILKELGGDADAVVAGLRTAYTNAKNKEKKKELDRNAKETAGQFDALGKYNIPKQEQRESLMDFRKTATEIIGEEYKISFDYAESLNKMVSDLEEAISSGSFDNIKGDALDVLDEIKTAAKQAGNEAQTLKDKLNLAEISEYLDEIKTNITETTIQGINGAIGAVESLYSAFQSIADLMGEELEWEGFEKFLNVVNAGVQVFSALKTVIEAVQAVEKLRDQQKATAAAKEIAMNAAVATSENAKMASSAGAAAAGGASSVASIPYVGPILAVAAVGTIIAAILAATKKFATGGLVNSPYTTGDKNMVRVNGGEMILNKAQQATLFNAINNGTLGGGNVEFKIRGADLIGAINNETGRRRG